MAAVAVVTSKTATLVGSVADTVTFTGLTSAKCEVVNLGASDTIWARIDGSAATVAGDESVPIPPQSTWTPPALVTTLSLISSGTPQYNVNRLVAPK